METDDFPDPRDGLRQGVFQYTGHDVPPEYEDEEELIEDQVPRVAAPSDHLPDVGPVPGGEEAFPMQV